MEDLKKRTRTFAVRIIKLSASLRNKGDAGMIASQLFRSGTSVGAHCAEASRARSRADYLNKIVGATQELEETIYWFELLIDSRMMTASRLEPLRAEARELLAILITLAKKTKAGGTK